MTESRNIRPQHLWITHLIALGMARADGEEEVFHRGGLPDAWHGDHDVHQDYLDEAHEVLFQTGMINELSLLEKLVQKPSDKHTRRMTITELETWIADREATVSKIDRELIKWKKGAYADRDQEWADRARHFMESSARQIRICYGLRLNLTRENDRLNIVPAQELRIAALERGLAAEREGRNNHAGQLDAQLVAMKDFLQAQAPQLLGEAEAACDAALEFFDFKRADLSEVSGAEPDPMG